MKSIKTQAIRSVIFNYFGYFVGSLLSIIATPIIIHSLGDTRYGIWSLVVGLTGYYGLLNLGIRSALTKYIAEYYSRNDQVEINKLINSSLVFFVVITLVILLFSIFMSVIYNHVFTIDEEYRRTIQVIIIVTGLNVAQGFIFQPFRSIMVAFNRFDISNVIGIMSSIIRTILLIILLKSDHGLYAMSLAILFVDLMTNIIVAVCSKKIYPELSLSFNLVRKRSMRKLWNFGIFNFMRHLSRVVLHRSDLIIIGIYMGAIHITIYTIGERLIDYVWKITKGISRVVLPVVSELDATNEIGKIHKIVIGIPKYSLLLSTFIFIQIIFFGDNFIRLWMGDGYKESYYIFVLLMIPKLGMMTSEPMQESLVGMGHNKFLGYVSIFEACANLGLSILLVGHYGLIGVAMGTVVPLLFTRSIVIPIYCCKKINIKLSELFWTVLFPAILTVLPCVLYTYLISENFSANTYLTLFACEGVVFLCFCINKR